MFSATSLLTFVTLALGVAANPIVIDHSPILSIPITKVHNFTSGHDILAHDRARVQGFKDRAQARASGQPMKRQAVPAINQGIHYITPVGVGADDSQFQLIVDTGGANTWVDGSQFSGREWINRVTLASSLVINQQSIGVASESEGFEGVDGVLGIGPVDLTRGTVFNVDTVPTVTDNLFSQGTIAENLVSVSFEPTTTEGVTNGELLFGGTDSSKFTGEITFTPRVGDFWGITQSVNYAGKTILSNLDGIVETGTTLMLLTEESYDAYISATGAVLDDATGFLKVTQAQFNTLQNLDFIIGGTTFSLTPNAQLFPPSLNEDIGGNANDLYLSVNTLTAFEDIDGLNFTNGYAFLERFYSVFDTGNNQVGIATTPFTNATTN